MDVAVGARPPDIWTFVGAAIIVTATSYIAPRSPQERTTDMTNRLG